MKNKKAFVLFAVLVLIPAVFQSRALAFSRECLANGYTVVYVNGIQTTRAQADADRKAFQKKFSDRGGSQSVEFLTGYNQTHAEGIGDKLKSVAQTYLSAGGSDITDYDLKTMLIDLASQIHTQKVLLVGHSQGTFYTNAMYDYLVSHGMPASSITVYNLATPASRVAGGGNYTTSSYDKAIEYVRELDASANAPQPLPANINIPIPYAERNDEWAGHHFQSDYLEGAPGQIVSDMQQSLARLTSWGPDASTPCFQAPSKDVAYKAAAAAYTALDGAARGAHAAGSSLASAAHSMQSTVGDAFASLLGTVVPPAGPDAAAGGMPLVNALYGSSIDAQTALELAKDEKADAAAAAAQQAAQEAALLAAPRIEAVKPKPYVPPANSQPAAAALAFDAGSNDAPVAPTLTPVFATPYQPGYGAGGDCVTNCSAPAAPSAPTPAPVVPPVIPPTPPDLTLTTPDDQSVIATTTVTFTGSSTPAAVVHVSGDAAGTASVGSDGSWSFTAILTSGTSTVSFVASKDGLDSSVLSRTIGVVLPPPSAPVVSATACTYSLSTTYCIIPATSANVSWTNPGAASSFDVYINGTRARTVSATSTSITLSPDATTTIEVVGHTGADTATSSALAIVSLTSPLRINEIAWAGTVQSANDQWLELRNASGYALDMSHVALVRSAGAEMQLSGTAVGQDALGNGYFLIERSEAATDVHADLIAPFDLFSQTGERVSLVWYDGSATTTLDATPVVAACHGWCAGHTAHALGSSAQPGIPNSWAMESMERIGSDGSLASSWQSNDTYTATAHDSSGYIIYGTPRAANSSGWPDKGWYCGASILTESSPVPTFPASQFCVVLSRFISPMVNRYVGFFIGDVGSSTQVSADLKGKVPTTDISLDVPGMNPGDHGFVVVWENRTNLDSDVPNFVAYLTGTQPTPPHSNYGVFPWIRQ